RKNNIKKQCDKISNKVQNEVNRPRFKIRLLFRVMSIAQKLIHNSLTKKGESESVDYLYWKRNGWLDGKKPWNKN
ncbi:MAG: hypothetical protein LBV51_03815, partial [Acholeplasmatales bacterium]|nr:hypothetical protein [Acholeplasmatales bacterium]